MADIDINAGLVIKADINQLLSDSLGALAKFKENRKFNESAYCELLDKYAHVVSKLQFVSEQINDLIAQAQANQLPDQGQLQTIDQFAGLFGLKKADGSVDLAKLMQLKNQFASAK